MKKAWIFIAKKQFYICLVFISAIVMTTHATDQVYSVTFPEYKVSDPPSDTTTVKKMLYQYDSIRPIDGDKAISILSEALEKSEAIGFTRATSVALSRLGREYQKKGEHAKALQYLLRALPTAEVPENIRNSNILYNNIGLCYSALGRYELALKFYYKAMAVLGKVKMKNGTDSVGLYSNIGILWARLDEMNYALRTFKLAEEIVVRTKDTFQSPMTYLNLGEAYIRLNEWDKAENYFNKVYDIGKILSSGHDQATGMISLAMVYKQKGQYRRALDSIEAGLALLGTENLSAYEFYMSRGEIGALYMDMKQYDKAKAMLLDALSAARKMDHQELLELLEPKVARVYAVTGEYDKAYEHLQAYTVIKDSLLKQEKARSLDAWLSVMMAEKNKTMLAQQLDITRQKNQLQRKNFWIAGSILGSLLLVTISLVFFRNYRHKQTIQQSLIYQLQQSQEINQLKAQVRGEEQERQRIARELHDNIAAQLWGIKLNVDNIQQLDKRNGNYDKKLASVFQQLTDAAQDVRKTAHNLMPDLLLEEGLATALASVCEKMNKNTNLEIDFQEYGVLPRLDKELELSIYRMVQELIQNVLKHAVDATHMLVQLSCAGTMLNITVEDNGTAFNVKEKADGIGLQQIRKRVSSLKGHFDLQSIPGKGTTAYLEFDLQHLL